MARAETNTAAPRPGGAHPRGTDTDRDEELRPRPGIYCYRARFWLIHPQWVENVQRGRQEWGDPGLPVVSGNS